MNITVEIPKTHIRVLPINPRMKLNSFYKLRRMLVKQPRFEEIKELWVSKEQYHQYLDLFPKGPNGEKGSVCMYQGIPLIIK